MAKFYKGTNDTVFKTIFGNNKYLLKKLLESALKLDDIEILDVKIPELPKSKIRSKKRILDVVIKSKGKIINIELNSYQDATFKRRNFSYLANLYINGLKEGEDYDHMEDYIQINISTDQASMISDYDIYKVTGKRYHQEYVDNFTIYEFNVTKMKETCYNEYRLLQLLDCDREELDRMSIGDKDMEELSKEIKGLNEDSEFIEFLTAEEEEEKYLNTVKNLEYQKGMDEGIEQVAKNMLNKGMDKKDISELTGLSLSQIEKIR